MKIGNDQAIPSWRLPGFKKPRVLIGSLGAFLISVYLLFPLACNLHELTHLIVSRAMGLEILWIQWCVPGSGGEVRLAEIPPPAESYTGGPGASARLILAYYLFIVRLSLPYQSPLWYSVGLAVAVFTAIQFLIGLLAGISNPLYRGDYGAMIEARPTFFVPLLIGAAAAGAAAHIYLWKRVLQDRGSGR